MIKAILFDFAGVIGTDGYWIWLREVVPNFEQEKSYFVQIVDEVDKGTITINEFTKLSSRKTGIPQDTIWTEISKRIIINHELVGFIKKLKRQYKIGLLTNFPQEWMNDILAKHNLNPLFDARFISSLHGMIKPEPGAFMKALELLDSKKEEVIFIDDRQVNVNAANALGIRSFLYTSLEQLKKDLKSMGVSG